MKQQPQLKARVGERNPNPVPDSLSDGSVDLTMLVTVEQAPDLRLPPWVAALSGTRQFLGTQQDRGVDQVARLASGSALVHLQVETPLPA